MQLKVLAPPEEVTWPRLFVGLVVAGILDLVDYFGGAAPVAGDIALDAPGIYILYKLVGPAAIIGILEFVPAEDFVPTFTLIVIGLMIKKVFEGRGP